MAAVPAVARDRTIHIPATTLDRAILILSRDTNTDIASVEPDLARTRVKPLDGPYSVSAALNRLLAGTDYRARRVGQGWRVERVAARPRRNDRRPPLAAQPPIPGQIIVTASKQRIDLLHYPAALNIIQPSGLPAVGLPDSETMVRAMPIIEGTALGPGRNKLFVRGIADSSFTGATQSTVSTYFGDVQLGYSGADRDLKLIDIQRVEVLEGPQGTLYGAGAIGGIIRITPNPVELDKAAATGTVGTSVMAKGDVGYDVSGVVNLPLLHDRLGVRLVGYRELDGGYIDDRLRRLSNVNPTTTSGARLAVAAAPAAGWLVEASGLWQRIDTPDSSYAQRLMPALTRASRVAQPFSSDLWMARLAVTKRWDSGIELFSATGLVDYGSSEIFDASPPAGAEQIYSNTITSRLLTHETRLSGPLHGGSWVAGFAVLENNDAQAREVGNPGNPTEIVGVTNIFRQGSVFGEVTVPTLPALSLTLGARGTVARNEATPSVTTRGQPLFTGLKNDRFDPTLAITYHPGREVAVYARYQTGYRTGGLAVARGVGRVSAFAGDDIKMGELGIRYIRDTPRLLRLSGAVAYARWNNIQADLFSQRNQPFTTTLGDASILSVETNMEWSPLDGLTLRGAALYADNEVRGPIADTSARNNRRLAQIPSLAVSMAAGYRWTLKGGNVLRLGATGDYVGAAVLGTGDYLDVRHPQYMVLGASVAGRMAAGRRR